MPDDPPRQERDAVDDVIVEALTEVLFDSRAQIDFVAGDVPPEPPAPAIGSAWASAPGPGDGYSTVSIQLSDRFAHVLADHGSLPFTELLELIPAAALATAQRMRTTRGRVRYLPPTARRVARDTLTAEILNSYLRARVGVDDPGELTAEVIEYLIEISGTRVEASELSHGVVIADALKDIPRIDLRYPADLRAAKRAPLLFDGEQSVLVVDPQGRARTEVQRHRLPALEPLDGSSAARGRTAPEMGLANQSLVADATRLLGGIGFLVRKDRSIWTFVDGMPLLVRRAERWTAFPLALTGSINDLTDGAPAAALVARTAFLISTRPKGAILAIVDEPDDVAHVVPTKDRYDLRNEFDPVAMRPETRLHHLIDTEDLDEFTLARVAALDGATILDRDGALVAYAAVVASSDSVQEGARTAAARSLSRDASVVLKVSIDGDITIFKDGSEVVTLLGSTSLGGPRSDERSATTHTGTDEQRWPL
ncbi:MAG: hypothetical protein ACK5O2_02380 [Microthrixaceae bacterium]